MRHPVDTPTVTAHALGELNAAEEHLLRMTFHSPGAARRLEEQTEEMLEVSIRLRDALQQETLPLRLSEDRRNAILAGADKFTRKRKSHSTDASPGLPKTEDEILRERKLFERRPSRLATYITLGAVAAVVVIFVSIKPLITGYGTEDGLGTSAGIGSDHSEDSAVARFNVIPEENPIPKALPSKPPQSLTQLPAPRLGDPAPIPPVPPMQGPGSEKTAIVKADPPKAPPAPPVVPPKKGEMQFTKDPKPPVFTSPK